MTAAPVDWQGIYVGGILGGAWNNSYWSDTFGSTPGAPGYYNTAGFGDEIHSTGP